MPNSRFLIVIRSTAARCCKNVERVRTTNPSSVTNPRRLPFPSRKRSLLKLKTQLAGGGLTSLFGAAEHIDACRDEIAAAGIPVGYFQFASRVASESLDVFFRPVHLSLIGVGKHHFSVAASLYRDLFCTRVYLRELSLERFLSLW